MWRNFASCECSKSQVYKLATLNAGLNAAYFRRLFSVISPDNSENFSRAGIDINEPSENEVFPQHECGLFGVFGHPNAAVLTYYGLFALQHRGQESAGIVTSNGPGTSFLVHKDMGLVSQVFGQAELEQLKGTRAIGHTRYSTTGTSTIKNAQPFVVDCVRGQMAIAHNGNLINADVLRDELERKGSIFQTTADSEIILHLLAQPSANGGNVLAALRRIEGAFSLVIMSERELIAVRDPFGWRPLSLGKLDGAYVISSETCAFDLIHAEFIREIEPGEVLIIDENGLRSERPFQPQQPAFCMFEYVYFARPDSMIGGVNVGKVRMEMGRELARKFPIEADIVVPVPDSGNYAALGFAQELKIPYAHAFVRNHYIGRTFLQPSQLIRDFDVRVKLNLIKEMVAGKRVVVVDDSIVRGTTSRARVVNLREAGAKEVHMRVSCPPHRFACHYGIDFPDPQKLIANQMSMEEIGKYLGVDSLGYLDVEGMVRATGKPINSFCLACFTGDYPLPVDPALDKFIMEKREARAKALADQERHPTLFTDLK
ncbi:MAG TPA: amidophosphoribosyltransferase [Chthoniobacterales bacterium]|nr:amidophosphoribosyltransferase [Chthoniobacterales bacterium]